MLSEASALDSEATQIGKCVLNKIKIKINLSVKKMKKKNK